MELIGRRFGHIRITDVVGQGGMGDVYAGYDEKLDRKVALKVLHAEQRLDLEARERLLREARALSKLDHPNICRIHDYIESDEVDLLVLEYIDGRTLQDVILDEQMPRAEKLRIAVSVAEVLVAAHRVGIIHRDLKPENVMLTRQREIKVLDFGLARWLQLMTTGRRLHVAASREAIAAAPSVAVPLPDESDHEWFAYAKPKDGETAVIPRYDTAPPQIRRRFLGTQAGVTMGTPLYMSPEQARGEELTTASDMYAFGLLLQALFTGGEPHPPGLTAREVILRAARGETIAVAGVSRDMTAVINRLKQFAPADRPTAIETVARLRFLADKGRRFARRAAVVAAVFLVIFGAWRYTVDLARERTSAVKARADAEKRRAQAEDLIEFMLGDLRGKLEPVGRLDILDDVGARALEYMESLRPEIMSAGELARNAKALNQLAEVRDGQGKIPAALELFGRSLKLVSEAVKREPKNVEALTVFGATHFWIGNGLQKQNKTDEALQHMREYMATGDTLAALDPRKQEYQLEKAKGHSAVAGLLEKKGRLPEAVQHYRTSLELYRRLTAFEPRNLQGKRQLAKNLDDLARTLERTGNTAEAAALRQERLALEKELADFHPT